MFSVNFMKIIFITLITILQSLAQTNNTTQSKFICPKSFYGPDCRRICVETDKYPNKLCDSEGLTRCKDGWTGLLCDRPICTESCGRGVCVAPNLCRCLSGTMGKECKECKPKKGCQHGYCNKAGECLCNNDWTGTLCQFKKDVCTTSNPCQNGGMCLQESNAGYECLCPYNLFGGTHCEVDLSLARKTKYMSLYVTVVASIFIIILIFLTFYLFWRHWLLRVCINEPSKHIV